MINRNVIKQDALVQNRQNILGSCAERERLEFHSTIYLRRDGREFWKRTAIGLQRREQDCRSTVVGLSVAIRRLYTYGINLLFYWIQISLDFWSIHCAKHVTKIMFIYLRLCVHLCICKVHYTFCMFILGSWCHQRALLAYSWFQYYRSQDVRLNIYCLYILFTCIIQ